MSTELTALAVYTKELRNERYSAIPKDLQLELIIDAKNGDEQAKEVLIETNLLFVLSEARKYVGMGLMLEELNSLGIEGLIMAIDKFKIGSSNASFTSVAKLWIKHKITRDGLFKRNIVRMPENQLELQRDGRYTGTYYSQSSLDFKNEDGDDLHEVIADRDTLVDNLIVSEEKIAIKLRVETILAILSDLELKIIQMNFGLNSDKALSTSEIAAELEMNKKEVDSILKESLKKMRN